MFRLFCRLNVGSPAIHVIRSRQRARAGCGSAHVLRHHSAERLVSDVDHLYRQLLNLPVEAP